jgi:hypothetical protein
VSSFWLVSHIVIVFPFLVIEIKHNDDDRGGFNLKPIGQQLFIAWRISEKYAPGL